MRRRRPLLPPAPTAGPLDAPLDPDDRFVRRLCARWLGGALARYPTTDLPPLELALWVLGPAAEAAVEYLLGRLAEDAREDLVHSLDQAEPGDASEVAMALSRCLGRGGRSHRAAFLGFLRSLLAERARTLARGRRAPLEKSAAQIQEALGLTDPEVELCLFLLVVAEWAVPQGCFDRHWNCDMRQGRGHLRAALGVGEGELRRAVGRTLGPLGALDPDDSNLRLQGDFPRFFLAPRPHLAPGGLFAPAPRETLPLDAHFVAPGVLAHLTALLREPRTTPAHVLLYGPPGTGKSSFARGLVASLGGPAWEVGRGDDNTSRSRRAALRACLTYAGRGPGAVVIADEADHLLNTEGAWLARGETQDKGWLNGLLEEPRVRMIWITNAVDRIDPSVLRRFAVSVPFRAFNRRQREAVWRQVLRRHGATRLVPEAEVAELAARHRVSAGVVDLAVRQARAVAGRDRAAFGRAVRVAVEASDELLGRGRRPREREGTADGYALEGLRTDVAAGLLVDQVRAVDRALKSGPARERLSLNLLFHGPPGTGKSELARHPAEAVGRELLVRRASDLLSMWVGGTEQNLAQAFAEAEHDGAVLVVDEADSFLGSRERAVRSWETSMVNEFLTQMERHRGILVCTTNRLDDLDPAALRRFQHKVGFGWLDPDGAVAFYARLLGPLAAPGEGALPPEAEVRLRRLGTLAPGDFDVVRRQFRFLDPGERTHPRLVAALEAEARLKAARGDRRPLGFGA